MRPTSTIAACLLGAGVALVAPPTRAERTLQDYRWFRALSIDLQGRMPTAAELARFERDDFDVGAWVDDRLANGSLPERVRRVYMDLLRLELPETFNFNPTMMVLRRQRVLGPDGAPVYVYYRHGQRRSREATDGTFCLTEEETGVRLLSTQAQEGTLHNVTRAALDANTVEVRPWWLYRDYRSASPTDRYGAAWAERSPSFEPVTGLQNDAAGAPAVSVRVCREEASTADQGTIFLTGRRTRPPGPIPYNRVIPLPLDSAYARANENARVACGTTTAAQNTLECGCGRGLERCVPGDSASNDPRAFRLPSRTPLGLDAPVDARDQAGSEWHSFWWSQEAQRFIEDLVARDRDFREVLTDRGTVVNGPLAQFYRGFSGMSCCNASLSLGYTAPEPLFATASIPTNLLPHDTSRWVRVNDRGPNAAGLLTMPIFLTKYGSRRARAHAVYNAFLCREFVAENAELTPSTNPNLMQRPGCAACHATLEPLAAYFSRVAETDWTFLPASTFPAVNPACVPNAAGTSFTNGACRPYYDPAFGSASGATLRGAYGSRAHADEGPAGLARDVTASPDFGRCVVSNVAESFLGRELTSEDDALRASLATSFSEGGYRVRALVRALVMADAYRRVNNLTPEAWREGEAGGGR